MYKTSAVAKLLHVVAAVVAVVLSGSSKPSELRQTAVEGVVFKASSLIPSTSQLRLWFPLSDTRTSTKEALKIYYVI